MSKIASNLNDVNDEANTDSRNFFMIQFYSPISITVNTVEQRVIFFSLHSHIHRVKWRQATYLLLNFILSVLYRLQYAHNLIHAQSPTFEGHTLSTLRYDCHFVGITWQCVELKGEDLSCYSNKIESVSLRKCPNDHWLTNKAYLAPKRCHSDKHFSEFYLQDGGKNQLA